MALPMPKFFNLGEPQCPPLPDEPYTVWEKIDGSLGIFWHSEIGWRCNTRGSFSNEYTHRALYTWAGSFPGGCPFPSHYTVMVEIVLPDDEMPRAAYKPPGLYLLAIRDNYSGKDVDITPFFDVMPHANKVTASIDKLMSEREDKEGVEGWVIQFDSGFRVKIKTKWYFRIFRAMQSMTPKAIRDFMVEAGENWIDEFPDDLRPDAILIQEEIETKYRALLRKIYSAYSKVSTIVSRKDYALKVLADYTDISGYLFQLRDDKFDEVDVLRRMGL